MSPVRAAGAGVIHPTISERQRSSPARIGYFGAMSVSSIGSGLGNGLSATQSAEQGIKRGVAGLARDSQVVAQAATGAGSNDQTTGALVDALQQKLTVEASTRALSLTDQALGTLLDVTA